MEIAVIGGGASGLVCAIKASDEGNHVTIYEKNNKCGKKILITGNGRCNYFNDDFDIKHYNSFNLEILKTIINEENKNNVLSFFEMLGIVPKVQNGYYYPVTNQAVTIMSALVLEAKIRGVEFITDETVIDINYKDNFIIETNDNEYFADKLVLATGSKGAPKTGSDGFGYIIAEKFKHNIIKPLPALVQLVGNEKYFKEWAGVRSDVIVNLYEDGKKIDEVSGEIQLTDYGVSGICIFQISSKVIRGLENGHIEKIFINFLPWLKEDIHNFLFNRNNIMPERTISELLDGMLNYKLVNLILKKNNVNEKLKYNQLSKLEIKSIEKDLINFELNISGYNDFDKCQVTSGGIPLNEININTFESLRQKNLYIIGELLDVDGQCGGYNLGFAWLSGILAGTALKEYYNDKN